mmetsp:Transcript_50852/g.118522  ORF Transcript_50852/g.118522 Transcript_50852/m.118522 type:complete len:535 (-) Transcript_50852:327-1931(-)
MDNLVQLDLSERGAREDCLGLFDGLHLLRSESLPGFEVLHQKVAALVEAVLRGRQGVQGVLGALPTLARLHQGFLQVGLLGLLVHDGLLLLLDGIRGVLRECLVGLLRALLRAEGLGLHGLGVIDQLLQHGQDAEALFVGLIILEALGGVRSSMGMHLDQGVLLVEFAQDLQGVLQQLLGLSLLVHHGLELCVLLLAVFPCDLQLLLHLRNLAAKGLDLRLRGLEVNGLLLGQERRLQAGLVLGLHLVLLKLGHAEVLLLHFILLLLGQRENHVVHGLLHLGELVDLRGDRQSRQARVFGAHRLQNLRGPGCPRGLRGLLEEGEGLLKVGVRLVGVQDLDGLGDAFGLFGADLLPLVPLGIHLRALLLHIVHKGQICSHQLLGILDVLLLDGVLFVCGGPLLLLGLNLRLASLDLRRFGALQLLVLLQRGGLVLLELHQLVREVILQAVKDPHHTVHAVATLQEGLDCLPVIAAKLAEMVLHQPLQHRPCDARLGLKEGTAFWVGQRGLRALNARQVTFQPLTIINELLELLLS